MPARGDELGPNDTRDVNPPLQRRLGEDLGEEMRKLMERQTASTGVGGEMRKLMERQARQLRQKPADLRNGASRPGPDRPGPARGGAEKQG